MSRWSPEALQFTLAPTNVRVARSSRHFGIGSGRHSDIGNRIVPKSAAGAESQPWRDAVTTMSEIVRILDGDSTRRARATVILSNHFARYALMPCSELIDDDNEEILLSRHCLRELYGNAAEQWELRIDPERRGPAKLVCAVEPELLEGLREVFAGSSIRLASIQPRLMAVCNRHRQFLGSQDAWLAVVEAGSLCLALLQHGEIVRLRHVRLGAAWAAELVLALDRENLLADPGATSRNVFVAAAEVQAQQFPSGLPWVISALDPPEQQDADTARHGNSAMA